MDDDRWRRLSRPVWGEVGHLGRGKHKKYKGFWVELGRSTFTRRVGHVALPRQGHLTTRQSRRRVTRFDRCLSVVFRSAKERPFAERKATLRQTEALPIDGRLSVRQAGLAIA